MKGIVGFLALAALVGICCTADGSVIYGDYGGGAGQVAFRGVTETTATPGDPEPLFEQPVFVGPGTLLFGPSQFVAVAPPADTTSGLLEMLIDLPTGMFIRTISIRELGDYSLLGRSALAQISTGIILSEDAAGSVVVETASLGKTYSVRTCKAGAFDVFDLMTTIDISDDHLEDVYLRLDNTLQAVGGGGTALIQKKLLLIDVTFVPEPATLVLVMLGALVGLRRR